MAEGGAAAPRPGGRQVLPPLETPPAPEASRGADAEAPCGVDAMAPPGADAEAPCGLDVETPCSADTAAPRGVGAETLCDAATMTDEAEAIHGDLLSSVSAAAGQAARDAVAAAFAELQAALLQAVAGARAPAQPSAARDPSRRPSAESLVSLGNVSRISRDIDHVVGSSARQKYAGCRGWSGSERDPNEAPVSKAVSKASANSALSEKSVRFFFPVCTELSEHSGDSAGRPTGRPRSGSIDSLPDARLSHSPPTVQSLQADLAQAVLQQGGFGTFSRNVSTWGRSVSTAGPRVAPDFEERLTAGSSTSLFASDAPLPKNHGARDGAQQEFTGVDLPCCTGQESQISERTAPSTSASGTASSRTDLHRMSSSEILRARCNQLALEATQGSLPALLDSEEDDDDNAGGYSTASGKLPRSVPSVMILFGLLPWDLQRRPRVSLAVQWICRAVLALCTAVFFLLSFGYIAGDGCGTRSENCWQLNGFFGQLPLPVGALVVVTLVSVRRHQRALEDTMALLLSVSFERRYQEWHSRQALGDKVVFVAIWFSATLAACIYSALREGAGLDELVGRGIMHAIVTSVLSGVVLSFAYGIVHVCRSLTIMIDAFCCDVVQQESAQTVAHTWNMTQAILRKASVSIEHCLLGLCFVLVFAVPSLLVDVLHSDTPPILTMIPTVCVTCGILYVLLLASMITEQCARVPALVNALCFGDGMEASRQQTVDYISSSAAGFYVFGSRLTTASVLKFMYVWCIVVLGLLTRLSTS